MSFNPKRCMAIDKNDHAPGFIASEEGGLSLCQAVGPQISLRLGESHPSGSGSIKRF